MASADNCELVRGNRTVADQQDSVTMAFAQVQQAHSTTQQAPRMVWNSEDDQVFLCGFASEHSFVGLLDDKDEISNEGIEDFIRQNNPDMYRRLFTNQSSFTDCQGQTNGTECNTSMPTVTSGVMATDDKLEVSSSTPKYYELRDVLLLVKRLLLSSLLGGHILVLQKLTVSYTVCGHPYCQFSDTPIPRGSFILQLRLEGALEVRHFCLRCIEGVFSYQTAGAAHCSTSPPLASMVVLDGVAEVIEAAQKLAEPLPKCNSVPPSSPKCKSLPLRHRGHGTIQNYFKPEFPFDHPSNSLQALSLRRRRDAEIDGILADVDKYQKRRQDDFDQPQKSPLAITPPPQMPGEERYKKQGLGRYDKEKEQRVIGRRDANSESSDMPTISTTSMKVRICKCREPSGVGVVLRCNAAFCPTGYFHLECTGLFQEPTANLVWTCSDCSGFPEGSLVAGVAAEASDERGELKVDDEHDYDYDYICDDDDDELSNENFDSYDELPESDGMSTATGRRTASPAELSDSDCMSTLTGVRGASPEEPVTLPRAVHTANDFTLVDQGVSELPATPPRRMTPTTSFTPINPNRTSGTVTPFSIRHTPFFSLDGGPPTAEGQAAACLPVGWSEVTFEDLAPFIIAETNVASYRTLSPQHMGMLEEWKAACPMSKLLPGQQALNPFHVNSVQTVPLSHLLAIVEAEMANK